MQRNTNQFKNRFLQRPYVDDDGRQPGPNGAVSMLGTTSALMPSVAHGKRCVSETSTSHPTGLRPLQRPPTRVTKNRDLCGISNLGARQLHAGRGGGPNLYHGDIDTTDNTRSAAQRDAVRIKMTAMV